MGYKEQEEKGTTEDEMAGWHHWLDGRESEWTPGDGDEQGGLVCSYSWGRKELDTIERLNWTELNWTAVKFIIMIKFKVIGISSLMELNTHKNEMLLGIPWQSSD